MAGGLFVGKDLGVLMDDGQDLLARLVLRLHDIEAVKFGRFDLPNGRTTPVFIDLRLLASYPQVMRLAAEAYQQVLEQLDFDLIAGTPLAGLPIGTAVSLGMDVPLIYSRRTTRQIDTGKHIEGKWEVGQTVVVLDDFVTSGESLLRGIAFLKAAGLRVCGAVVLIDMEQRGMEMLSSQGYRLYQVMTISRMLEILEENGRLSARKRLRILRGM